MPSFSYRLVKLALRAKGIKKAFAGVPLPVGKIRKEDVLLPPRSLNRRHKVRTFQLLNSSITELQPKSQKTSDHLIFYCHGGAFISGPSSLHWQTVSNLAQQTGATVWLIRYPKAPESQIEEICENVDAAYEHALASYAPQRIALMGDSVGGTLVLGLAQRLVRKGGGVPGLLVGITPVVDSSMSNPDMAALAAADPILVREGLLQAKKMVAGNLKLEDERLSPINGSFVGFPKTCLFVGGKDILGPDAILLSQRMLDEGVALDLVEETEMPHIWPLLPAMKEAKLALNQIASMLRDWMGKA